MGGGSHLRLDTSNKDTTMNYKGREKMPWIEKEYNCGNCIIVKKGYASRYGAKREIAHITNKTTEIQQRVNDRNAMFRYSILANANFKKGDFFITYTFRKSFLPPSVKDCKKLWAKYRRKIRNYYKKLGSEFKYIYAFEHEGVRPHFHMLFNNPGMNIADLPQWEFGIAHIECLDDREYHSIGEYFVKIAYDVDNPDCKGKGELGCSRNLYRPEPDIKVLEGPNWDDQPEEREGYEIDYDSLENGYVEVIENHLTFRFQTFRYIRLIV